MSIPGLAGHGPAVHRGGDAMSGMSDQEAAMVKAVRVSTCTHLLSVC